MSDEVLRCGHGALLTVETRTGAGITTNGTTRGRGSLSGGIIDVIARSATPTLEGMEQPDPVSDFMNQDTSRVVAN